jgi:hypothetical protein
MTSVYLIGDRSSNIQSARSLEVTAPGFSDVVSKALEHARYDEEMRKGIAISNRDPLHSISR